MASERTETATPRKLRQARERGEAPRSADLTLAGALLALAGALTIATPDLAARVARVARFCLESIDRTGADASFLQRVALSSAAEIMPALAAILACVAFAAAAVAFLQVGPLLTFAPLIPKLERLNPVSGLKQRVFSARAALELAKSLLSILIVGMCCVSLFRERFEQLPWLVRSGPRAEIMFLADVLLTLVWRVLACFVVLATIDVFLQRWQFARDQRMSKDEVKQDYKNAEGDPHLKHARKRLHHELAMGNMLGQVQAEASLVVKNPTHFACALHYDPRRPAVPPRLIAKGQGWLAEKIRETARRAKIPVVRNVPLARALYRLELDESIPPELYDAVVATLRWAEEEAASRDWRIRWRDERELPQSEHATDDRDQR